MKSRNLLLIMSFCTGIIFAQQESGFSHYMFNHQAINPGYAGARELPSFTSVIRSQWSGIEGAPLTQTLSFNSPLSSKNLGFGLSVLNDKIGPTSNTSFDIDFAYHLKLNRKEHRLSIGIKSGIISYYLNNDLLNPNLPNDPTFVLALDKKIIPTIGFGAYYYTPKYYFGLSIPRLIDDEYFGLKKHFYAFTGGIFPLSNSFMIKPSLMIKYTQSIASLDVSLMGIFNERFWVGIQARNGITNEQLQTIDNVGTSALFGIHLGQKFSIGYSYGFPSSIFNNSINMSTHEVMLRFDLSTKSEGYLLSPRFF